VVAIGKENQALFVAQNVQRLMLNIQWKIDPKKVRQTQRQMRQESLHFSSCDWCGQEAAPMMSSFDERSLMFICLVAIGGRDAASSI